MKHKLRKTDLYLTIEQHKKIKEISDGKNITFSELFRRIIDWYLEEKYTKCAKEVLISKRLDYLQEN